MHRAKSILIVEDYFDTCDVLTACLLNSGYKVTSVSTRDEALECIASLLPDLVIMDYCMPGLSLDEFLEATSRFRATVHFLIMSSDAQLRAEQYHVRYFIKKPFELDDLEVAVRNCLAGGSSSMMPAIRVNAGSENSQ